MTVSGGAGSSRFTTLNGPAELTTVKLLIIMSIDDAEIFWENYQV